MELWFFSPLFQLVRVLVIVFTLQVYEWNFSVFWSRLKVVVKSPDETIFESLTFWIRSQSLNLSRICSSLNPDCVKKRQICWMKLLTSSLSFVKEKRFSWFLDDIFKFLMFLLYHWQLDKLSKVHLTPTRLLISGKKTQFTCYSLFCHCSVTQFDKFLSVFCSVSFSLNFSSDGLKHFSWLCHLEMMDT